MNPKHQRNQQMLPSLAWRVTIRSSRQRHVIPTHGRRQVPGEPSLSGKLVVTDRGRNAGLGRRLASGRSRPFPD